MLQYANVRILRCRDKEAVVFMDRILDQIENCLIKNLENYPNHQVLINVAKNYIELENYEKSIKTLDVLVKQDDENIENWYLLAFSHFRIKNNKFAMKCLKILKKTSDKVRSKDKEIEDAASELFKEIEKLKDSKGELFNSVEFNEENDLDDDEKEMNID